MKSVFLFFENHLHPGHQALSKASALALFILLHMAPPVMAAIPLEIEVIGLENPLQKNVLHFLDIEKQKDNEELTIRWIKRLHEQAPQEIREALQPYGYYLPDIQTQLTETEGKWLATYTIDKGDPVKINKRDIQWFGEGAAHPVFQKSIQDYYKNAGNLLVHSEYESAKNKFMNLALSNGYPRAKFIKSEWLIDLDTNSADLKLYMDSGQLYYFGNIRFQQDFLDPDLLQHYISIEKGSPYSHEALLEFQQNLIAGNYAKEVTINPLFHEARQQHLPLNVLMKPITPHKFSFGLGYETGVGVRGSARWTDRLINRHGHHSEVYTKLSQREGTLRGQYSIPVIQPLTDRWVSTASYEYEETPDTSSNTFELETAFVRRNLEDTHFHKGFLLASSETFTVGADPKKTTNLLTLGGTMRFSEMEDTMFPQKGHYLFTDLRGAAEALLSDTSFTRMHLKGIYMLEVGENGRIDTRLEIGAAWVDDFSIYPTSLRFFAGGGNSVRGYAYESLSPTDDKGVVVGGKQIFSTSFEYDHRVSESWVIAGFVDAGNAYDNTLDKTFVGAGAGFRWLAPFGSLRVDIAYPVSEQPELSDWRIHIGFGATL
jgi:translocation and assembly module TamA